MTLTTGKPGWPRLPLGITLALALVYAGCESPNSNEPRSTWRGQPDGPSQANKIDPTKIDTRDDIFSIVQFWPQTPWLRTSDRVVGFKVTVYFRSGETELGAFVPGTIFVWLYEMVPTADGRRERKIAYGWEFDQAGALAYRVTKRAIGGYYYGFPLIWSEELALEGKLIEIQFGYERGDQRLILSEPRQFRVPVPYTYQPPIRKAKP